MITLVPGEVPLAAWRAVYRGAGVALAAGQDRIAASAAAVQAILARIIHRTARNRPRPPNSWARDFIAKNFIKRPIRIVVNDINGLALIAHFS